MSVRVGFLRAVNLGGRRVPMIRLVQVCESLGYADVWTYVNAATSCSTRPERGHRSKGRCRRPWGTSSASSARPSSGRRAARNVLDARPFTLAAGDTHFVTFLKETPSTSDAKRLEGLTNDFDTLVVHGSEVHWRMRGRSTDSHQQA